MEKGTVQTKRKPYKIVICGPESTGKSTLCQKLATHYNTSYSEEYLREFASNLYSHAKKLEFKDNFSIAKGQISNEINASENADKLYFCDTDLLQTIIYSNIYYSKVQDELIDSFRQNIGDHYILLSPDVEWEYDILRDENIDRGMVFQEIKKLLESEQITYSIVSGIGKDRLLNAIKYIDHLID